MLTLAGDGNAQEPLELTAVNIYREALSEIVHETGAKGGVIFYDEAVVNVNQNPERTSLSFA